MVIMFNIAVHVAFYCLNNEDGSCKHASTVAGLSTLTNCVWLSLLKCPVGSRLRRCHLGRDWRRCDEVMAVETT